MILFSGRRISTILAAVFMCGMALPAETEESSYVLALSWQPAFCESDNGAGKTECRWLDVGDWAASHFTLHGLWPTADRNGDGRMDVADDYCLPPESRARAVALDKSDWRNLPAVTLPSDLQQRLSVVMPGTASRLERHQWIKHGTCSGLSAPRYFAAGVALTEAVAGTELGSFISARMGEDVARGDVLAALAAEFGKSSTRALQLICRKDEGVSVLSELRLRLRANAVEAPLSPRSFDTAKEAKGNCPARFRVVVAE